MATPFDSSKYPTKSKTKRALRHVKSFMDNSREYTRPYFKKFNALWEEYHNRKSLRKSSIGRSNLQLAQAFTIAENLTSQLFGIFTSEAPYVTAQANKAEGVQFESGVQMLFTQQLDKMGFLPKFNDFIKLGSIFGISIAKIPWKYTEEPIFVEDYALDIETGDFELDRFEKVVTTYDGPDFMPILPWDFFPDWTCSNPGDIQSMRGCVHRIWKDLDKIKKDKKRKLPDGTYAGIYSNVDMLERMIENGEDDSEPYGEKTGGMYYDNDYKIREDVLDLPSGIKQRNKVELWEYVGYFDETGKNDYKKYLITIANGQVVLRLERLPYNSQKLPYVAWTPYTIPGEFYGMGDIEPVWSLIQEAKMLRNARLDQAHQATNRMWLIDKQSGLNLQHLYFSPNKILAVDDLESIKPMEVAEPPSSSYNEVAGIDLDIQNVTGMIAPNQMSNNMGRAFTKTATGVSFLNQMANNRLKLKAILLEKQVMSAIGQHLLALNKQFLSEDQWIRLTGRQDNPFVNVPLEAFACDYEFSTPGALERVTMGEEQTMLLQAIAPMVQQLTSVRPYLINHQAFFTYVLEKFRFKNPNMFFNPPEMEQQQSQQAQQAEMQKQMMMTQNAVEAQASAQSRLAKTQGQIDAILQQDKFENEIVKEMTKGVIDGSKSK